MNDCKTVAVLTGQLVHNDAVHTYTIKVWRHYGVGCADLGSSNGDAWWVARKVCELWPEPAWRWTWESDDIPSPDVGEEALATALQSAWVAFKASPS